MGWPLMSLSCGYGSLSQSLAAGQGQCLTFFSWVPGNVLGRPWVGTLAAKVASSLLPWAWPRRLLLCPLGHFLMYSLTLPACLEDIVLSRSLSLG